MNRFIYIQPLDEWIELFSDLRTPNEAYHLDVHPMFRPTQSRLLHYLEYLIVSDRVGRALTKPFKRFVYNLEKYPYREEDEYYLLLTSPVLWGTEIHYLEVFKNNHPNIHYVAVILDSMHAGSPHMQKVRDTLLQPIWDIVLTFDREDAREYGFAWLGYTYYSSTKEARFVTNSNPGSDICYVGFDVGREEQLSQIYKQLKMAGLCGEFYVVTRDKNNALIEDTDIIVQHKPCEYSHVLDMVRRSNCILEVLKEGQNAQTARYFEAVVYNKKLLTNFQGIRDLPYYDERYMRTFETVEDIDMEWIRRREKIDYGYQGEFSPLNLIPTIKEKLGLK